MNSNRIASQIFIGLSFLGLLIAIVSKFYGPILGVSQQGFLNVTDTCLLFVLAISLTELAFATKKSN